MDSAQVLTVLDRLDASKIPWWIAGGWAIDALVGNETRHHDDLDLVVPRDSVPTVERLLGDLGYVRAEEGELPAFLILRDAEQGQVDLYVVSVDAGSGEAWQEFGEDKWDYFSPADMVGVGTIAGRRVRCLSPEALFRQFLGYRWTEKAREDLLTLHRRFGTPIPPDMA